MNWIIFILILASVSCTPSVTFRKSVEIPPISAIVFSSPYPTGVASKGWMMISGKVVDGKIMLDKDVAWHELQHIFNIADPVFANPDK